MKRLVLDHLEDILENALAAGEFVGTMSCEAFGADRKTLYAVLRALEVIGEAAKRVPPSFACGIQASTGAGWRACATSSSTSMTGSTIGCRSRW